MNAPWLLWLGGFLLVWTPGIVWVRILRVRRPDLLVTFALELGLGLAWWPLLLLWTTQAGLRWSPPVAQAAAAVTVTLGLVALLWSPTPLSWRLRRLRRQGEWLGLMAVLTAITVQTRLAHIRGLALPVWVDPVHHVTIVRLMAAQGAVPTSYAPYIPGGVFTYHWGFHALPVWTVWLLGLDDAFDLADTVLQVGQLLNVLTVPMFYAAGRLLFASRRAGLFTAAVVGVVSWFPAYYLSWGRYTHLTGVLLLPPLLIVLWRLRRGRTRGSVAAAVMLAAGLALIHVRVAFFAAILVALLGCVLVWQRRLRPLVVWGAVALLALLLTGPWWLWLAQSAWARSIVAVQGAAGQVWADYNVPNWGLVWAPRNALLIALGTFGLGAWLRWEQSAPLVRGIGMGWPVSALGLALWSWSLPRLRRVSATMFRAWLLLVAWVAVTLLVLQGHLLGLPHVRFVHINAGIMTLFAALGPAVGGLTAWALGVLAPPRAARALTGGVLIAAALWGSGGMQSVVNRATILATPADRAALLWIRDHTPPDARFAVNTWRWLANTYAGSDGGYWIPVLTDRASVLPSTQYASALPRDQVLAVHARLARLANATSLDDPSLRAELVAQGVTYLYIGPRAGALRAEQIDGRPFVNLLYRRDGVSIYALDLSR